MNNRNGQRNFKIYSKMKEYRVILDCKVKSLTQCVPNDKEIAFALILDANISGRRRAGTGPAPREKDNT